MKINRDAGREQMCMWTEDPKVALVSGTPKVCQCTATCLFWPVHNMSSKNILESENCFVASTTDADSG